ncbi:hypothetical protein [Sphingobacterium sp.]|uniref:DUF6712 family protein n=1 Tax=Sphingobacterium sp. TaxID=341027 RepID=UPI0028AB432F|nr:hypothetical protein [Sphingobacterium sp.]
MAKIKKGYLISANEIKEESILSLNTDDKIIEISIREAYDLDLEPLVGIDWLKTFSDSWMEKTLNDKEKHVLNSFIKPFLIYATLVRVIPYLHNKLNNKGLNKSTDITLAPNTTKEVALFQQLVNQRLDSYKLRLVNFFKNDDDKETNPNPLVDTTGASAGFYLPDYKDESESYYKARASKVNYWRGR